MKKIAIFLAFIFIILSPFGCQKRALLNPTEEKLAEIHSNLLVLYNKNKLPGNLTDSLYQIKSDSVLSSFGYSKLKYEEGILELEKDNFIWKIFITKSLENYDSLRE